MKGLIVGCLLGALLAIVAMAVLTVGDDASSEPQGVASRPVLVAKDSSGWAHHGIIQGHPRTGIPGHRGTAYSFEQDGSWIQVPSAESLNPQHADFVLSAWVSLTEAPKRGETWDILRKGLTWTRGGTIKLEVIPGGLVKCLGKDSRGRVANIHGPQVDIADGAWHLVRCARTGTTWTVVVDQASTSKDPDLGSISNAMPLSIGSKYGMGDGSHDGRLDEVSVHLADPDAPYRGDSPLSAVVDLLDQPPVALWHLDERVRVADAG